LIKKKPASPVVMDRVPVGAEGVIVDGPEFASGAVWWAIQFQNMVTGWVEQRQLDSFGALQRAGNLPSIPPIIAYDLHYGPLDAQELDLCLPRKRAELVPAVVIIHGGGWAAGSKANGDALCSSFARSGIAATSIDYRLYSNTPPRNLWPSQLVDAQLAVRWLRAHAAQYEIDPARICAWGSSAGAHIAALLALTHATHPGDYAGLQAGQSSAVACAIDISGPTDLTDPNDPPSYRNRITDNSPSLESDASPLLHVSSECAPMLIVQGDQDPAVSPSQAISFYRALRKYAVPAQFWGYNGTHDLNGLSPIDRANVIMAIKAYVKSSTERVRP
jgi:acetyl esterase/lipase